MTIQSGGRSGYTAIDREGKGGKTLGNSVQGEEVDRRCGEWKKGKRREGGWSEPVEK